MENRTWEAVIGYKGAYEVSSDGLVRSVDRKVHTTKNGGGLRQLKGRVLVQHLSHNGYPIVDLSENGNQRTYRVHKLVAYAFLGVPNNKNLVVHHIDNNKQNNNSDNLEYCSRQKNTQEYYKTIGKANGFVPYDMIPTIIRAISNGEKVMDVASEYGVTRNDIAVLCKIIALTGEELTIK